MKAALVLVAAAATARADTLHGVVEVTRPKDVAPGPILVYVVGFTEKAPVTAGGTVAFPNGDPLLHNVFSPTTERSFDLGSFKQGDSRSRTFPKPGVVDVYCNLHPEMSATLVILPNTRFAIADATGHFEIKDVPPGAWTVFAYSRHAIQPTSVQAGGGELKLHLDEVQRDFTHRNKYGETYRPTTVYPPGS